MAGITQIDRIFRFLLAATLSTIVGPTLLLQLRSAAEMSAIQDLLAKVDPDKFMALFGADVSQAQSLIESKALTISKLVWTKVYRDGRKGVQIKLNPS